jgi:hypothetical protein
MKKHEISDLYRLYHIKEAINFIPSHTTNLIENEFYSDDD